MVQTSVIASMVVCALLSVVISIGAIIFFSRKVKMNLSTIFLGIILYVGFSTILLNMFDNFILRLLSSGVQNWLFDNPVLYALYYAFIHALFFTAGFYTIGRMAMRADTGVGTGVALGLGCAGTYAVLDTGVKMFNYIMAAFDVNKNGIESFMASATEENFDVLQSSLDSLLATTPLDIATRGIEMIIMFALFVAIGTIIQLAVTHRCHISFVYAGMGILFVAYLPTAFYNVGLLPSAVIVEMITAVVSIITCVIAARMASKYKDTPMKF